MIKYLIVSKNGKVLRSAESLDFANKTVEALLGAPDSLDCGFYLVEVLETYDRKVVYERTR